MIFWNCTTIVAQLSYNVNKYNKIGDLWKIALVHRLLEPVIFIRCIFLVSTEPTNLWDLICNDTSNSARLIHIFDMKSKSIAGTKKHQDILLISNIAKDRRSLKDIFLLKKRTLKCWWFLNITIAWYDTHFYL